MDGATTVRFQLTS